VEEREKSAVYAAVYWLGYPVPLWLCDSNEGVVHELTTNNKKLEDEK
jgi:hypothetical protein